MDRAEACEILNFYRNQHYTEPLGTEERELSDAINAILPHYAALREQEQREQGCEVCRHGKTLTAIFIDKNGGDRLMAFAFCPMCGRKMPEV